MAERDSGRRVVEAEGKERDPVSASAEESPAPRPVALVDASVLRQMACAIVDEVDPDRIILFGSHAGRSAGPDSDVDLIVIEREPFGPGRSRLDEIERLYGALSDFFVPKDILVFSREEVERWRDSINHVLARSLREGVVLYERP